MRNSKIGRLSNIITVQSAVLVPDGSGGNIETWVNSSDIWAEAMPYGSNRMIDMGQNAIHSDVTFRIRKTTISKLNRIVYDSRVCVIDGIRYWEQDQEFQLIECRYNEGSTGIGGSATSEVTSGINKKYLTVVAGASITDVGLVGADIINVFRNGIAPKIITSGTPTGEEVLFDMSSGTLTFSPELIGSEYIYVIWLAQ